MGSGRSKGRSGRRSKLAAPRSEPCAHGARPPSGDMSIAPTPCRYHAHVSAMRPAANLYPVARGELGHCRHGVALRHMFMWQVHAWAPVAGRSERLTDERVTNDPNGTAAAVHRVSREVC